MKRYWWDRLELCQAKKKDGSRCNNFARKPYEIELRNLFIPLTFCRHQNQERELMKKVK